MAIRNNGEVPFTPLGEGVFLCFNLQDIAELEQHFGVGAYYGAIELNLLEGSADTVLRCLRLGLKRLGSDGRRVRVEYDPDEMAFPVGEAKDPIMDALTLSAFGISYAEALEQAAARAEEAQQDAERIAAEAAAAERETDPLPNTAGSSDRNS